MTDLTTTHRHLDPRPATPASASPPSTRWSPPSAARSTTSRAPWTSTARTRPQSSATVTIQAASFDSGNGQRDGHVSGADFLDVENYPTLTFALHRGPHRTATTSSWSAT